MDRETSLSIAHLNKLFLDIKQTSPPLGSSQAIQEQHEQRLYNLLPLFCKLFTNNGSESVSFQVFEKFVESTAFTQMVSRLMVTEIRRRASNKTTENASVAIVEFLEIQETVNSSAKGWILLSTLNILVSFNSSTLISIMTLNSLASTLVKCLYLFFDLPPCVDSIEKFHQNDNTNDDNNDNDDFMTNTERRCLLQKVFSQLLTRLCSSSSALNDLTKKDDLSLLFNAMTSWCPEHNLIWRQTASDVIITMARHGNMNAEYLRTKNCISLFVENTQRIVELDSASNTELLSMFDHLIKFFGEYSINVTPNQVHILLEDFSNAFGYQFLVDFILRLEQYQDDKLLHEMIQIIQYFTKIGISPLKPRPLSVNQLFIIENFSIPKPSQKTSVKNLKAFNIFVSLWLKGQSKVLQCKILESIINIYRDDKANYFILESQNSLAAFGEKIDEKPISVQKLYYSALEFVVFELNYVPCKELITVGIVLKNNNSQISTKYCLSSLNRIMGYNQVFRDVCREVGLLDIICSLYSNQIQQIDDNLDMIENENSILFELVEFLIQALSGPNNSNCNIFHECLASKYTFTLISHSSQSQKMKQLRKRTFHIIQHLICSPCGEDILSQLLVLLHSFESQDTKNSIQNIFSLKLSVLKTLLIVLSENHRIRALFRKIGGFVSVMSVIVSMEHCLSDNKQYEVEPARVWNLLRCVFATITTAMRFEPANAKYFAQEICFPSFTDSLRLLGCFESNYFTWNKTQNKFDKDFEFLFEYPIDKIPPYSNEKLDKSESACLLLRFLYEMSIDILDRSSQDQNNFSIENHNNNNNNNDNNNNNNNNNNNVSIVIYPCVVICILNLTQFVASKSLCLFMLEKIRRLFTTERNLQVFCDYGFLNELLQNAYADVFQDETHPLNSSIQYMFEKLSAQHIQPKDLRTFLRLSYPLNCIPLDEIKPRSRPMIDKAIPISRIKSIISMSTPRDGNVNRFLLDPPFIEFDMSQEGFSCIFIPSLAPISTVTPTSGASNLLTGAIVGNNDVPIQVIGGIGTGERTFPSQSGLSFTTWIYIKNQSTPTHHPIGLLTLYRANSEGQDFSCFHVTINPKERNITISTQEAPIFANSKNMKSCFDSDHNIRFPVPELFDENWHHITVILNRALLKNSTISVWIDAKLKVQQKMHYISSIVGGVSGISNTQPIYVNGFIGTPPHYRRHCGLVWKQGPCHLIEEPLHPSFVGYIYILGPNYIGSFQAINYLPNHLQLSQQQQISEDRLIFGLNSRATSVMTLSKMRRVYSKFDCKQIAKIIGLSTHENATPIYVLHNSSGHLCGPSRPLGGVLIGNVGARCFVPKQIPLTLSDIGGVYPLLGLIATSQTAETLYASVKSLVCVLRTNTELQLEMERVNGFQTLQVLLKRKKQHLNANILHLIFELIDGMCTPILGHTAKSVYMNLDHNISKPSNYKAFKELLVDSIDVWFSCDLLKTLLEHFNETLNDNLNVQHLREMKLLSRLINICKEQEIEDNKTRHLVLVMCFKLLNQTNRSKDILYFGQFIASLIPIKILLSSENDREYVVQLRNSFLKVVLQLMSRNNSQQNLQMQEDLTKILGFDWFLLCLKEDLNEETITIGLVNLMIVLSNQSILIKFKQALINGGWLKDVNLFVQNKANNSQLLGFNISANINNNKDNNNINNKDINNKDNNDKDINNKDNNNKVNSFTTTIQTELFTLPGFQHLNWLLSDHIYRPKVYFILFQTILGEFKQLTPLVLERIDSFEELNFEHLIRDLCDNRQMKNFKQEELYLKEIILTLLSMIHEMIILKNNDKRNIEYTKEVLNFIKYLYENNRDLRFWCQNNFEFLSSLCKTMLHSTNDPDIDLLTNHPSKRILLDFILTIFINIINTGQSSGSFQLATSATSMFSSQKAAITIFENILLTLQNCKLAQTELISLFMDHVMSSQDMNQNQNLPDKQQSTSVILNFNHSFVNIVLIMGLIVDKLWQDCYICDRKKILECLIKLLKLNFSSESTSNNSSVSKLGLQQNLKSLKSLTFQLSEVSLLYKCVNRTVLYLISRKIDGMSDRMFIFEVLQLIYQERSIIIANKNNSDSEFFICLTHCLLQLIDEEAISLSISKRSTTWYISDLSSKNISNNNANTNININTNTNININTNTIINNNININDNYNINNNNSNNSNNNINIKNIIEQRHTDEGAMLIATIAKKIWNEIYLYKKNLIEDILKINLSANQGPFGVNQLIPDISQLRDILYESTLKGWHIYIDSEQQRYKKRSTTLSFDLPNSSMLTEKLTNMNRFNTLVSKSAGGLVSKFVGGTAVGTAISSAVSTTKKEVFRTVSDATGNQMPIPIWNILTKQEVINWTSIHLSIVNSFIEYQSKQKRIYDQHLRRYIFNEWLNDQYEYLTRERAIWGPAYGSKRFDKWLLDMTEGPNRMRKKFIRNDQFYFNYPYRPEFDSAEGMKLAKFKAPISLDSKDYYKRIYCEKFLQICDNEDESFEVELCETFSSDSSDPIKRPSSRILRNKASSSDCDEFEAELNHDCDDTIFYDTIEDLNRSNSVGTRKEDDNEMQTILRLLEEDEKISYMFRVSRIQGLDSFEGLLLFGKEHFYLVDGFTLLKTKEIRDIDSLPLTIYEPIVPNTNGTPKQLIDKQTSKKVCNKFSFEDIREVHKRRYLLQPIALEVFSADGRNTLMVFPRNIRNKVYTKFTSLATQTTDSAQDSLMGQKKSANVESGGLLSGLGLGETSVTQRWIRGEISNFQYLMHLNTLAGRSYNDLMQYPVFPWILADYNSAELDLYNPATFRDLSKPMGAQTPARLEQFKKRFSEFEADALMAKSTGDDLIQGAYHYGTFYSSAMIVASYLVRIEPFSQHFLRLQGGHFDLADRMFHSVGDAWHSASKNNMADLKELIPEFFYLPDFLMNTNRFDFGTKQNGTRLNNVVLPPWSKGDPREFIRLHRHALECDFVSAHLHEWIDLIFGFKQNGPAAVEATNVFHHLFYEGNVDIYSIDDPLKKNATIGFINNFGQIPKQLFKKPHPSKKVFSGSSQAMSLTLPGGITFGSSSPLSSTVSLSKAFIHHMDNLKPTSLPVKECKGAVGQIIQATDGKTLLAVEQNKVLLPPTFNRYVAWGFADHSLRIGPYESDRALYVWESELFPPNGEILCATVPNARLIITAGTNAVVNVWRLKAKNSQLGLAQKLYGHTEAITCLTSSPSFGIIVSGSRDKTCILWDLNRLLFIRQLGGGPNLTHQNPVAAVAINDLTGDIATCCSTMLYLWSINGHLVASVNTLNVPGTFSSQQNNSQILCLAFSTYNEWDSNNVILTGSSDGVVRAWSVDYAQEKISQKTQYNDDGSGLIEGDDDDEKDNESNEEFSSDDEEKCKASNLSKDDIVRRLSTVSIQHANEEGQNSSEDSSTPVDPNQPNEADWDVLSQQELTSTSMNISKSKSFLENEKYNEYASTATPKNAAAASATGISSKTSSQLLQVPQNSSLRNSKSDTALVDSGFVVVSGKAINPEMILKPGYQWVSKLVFKSKLTMHTAFERKDNREPAAITCISISRDHRTVFVGDARGRIWSWSVNESNKSMSDHWVKDDMALNCSGCNVKFTLTERKHHCRQCGLIFCSKCSRFEATIPKMKIYKPVRVCEKCYQILRSNSTLK